jgi:hypothetical protein
MSSGASSAGGPSGRKESGKDWMSVETASPTTPGVLTMLGGVEEAVELERWSSGSSSAGVSRNNNFNLLLPA